MSDYKGKLPTRPDGIYELVQNEQPASAGVIANERNATHDETKANKRVTAKPGDEDKIAMDVSISDGDGNSINKNNPLPVYFTDSPSTEVEDYDVQNVLKNGGSANHDYTAGSEFRGLNASCSCSGLAKFELLVETGVGAGTYETRMVKFNSVSQPQVEFALRHPKPVASGVKIRIVKHNLDNQDTDMYSTINGVEV